MASSGCDVIYGLERDPPPEFENYDRCGSFLFDEPLRYASIGNPNVVVDGDGNPIGLMPWSWDDARTQCQQRGMDLAVFNDQRELGMGAEDAAWPYWIGQRTIGTVAETVDGCPALTAPSSLHAIACGMVTTANEIGGASCDGQLPPMMEPNVVIGALCETPRPDSIACLGQNPAAVEYFLSDSTLTYDRAKAFCASNDAHLVVVETHEEWLHLSKRTKTEWEKPFWLGSRFDGTTWKTENDCFGTYSWTGGTPGTPANGSCVASKVRVVDDPEEGLSGTVLDGVEPTACSEPQSFALCEID
ncbi:MAG: C-type lectin domain-containing protein [Deltaproteobacteria bacterium]|nr:C-type lectin domain-containing protein [Deltaproteobacteria bacterium]